MSRSRTCELAEPLLSGKVKGTRLYPQVELHEELDFMEALLLFTYFQRRRCYENQDFSDFDTATLIRFREEKERFAGEPYDGLYAQWKAGDLVSLGGDLHAEKSLRGTSLQQFSTYLLEHDYDLFGSLTREYDKRTNDEIQTEP